MLWISSCGLAHLKAIYTGTRLLKWRALLLGIAWAMTIPCAYAAVPADENFDGVTLSDAGGTFSYGAPGAARAINNWTFTLLNAAGTQDLSPNAYVDITNDLSYTSLANNSGDKAAYLNGNYAGGTGNAAAVLKATSGEEFSFVSVRVEVGASAGSDYRLVGYLNGSAASGATQNFTAGAFGSGGTLVTVSGAVWQYVDEVRIVRQNGETDVSIYIDDVDISAAVAPDSTPPVVSSITKSGVPAENAASITYVVAFNESASNVSTNDFQVTNVSGTAAGTVSAVSAATGASINVTVSSISGTGSIRLDLKANTNITDAAGNGNNTNGYVATYTSGATHTVDRDTPSAPSVPNLTPATDSGSSSTDDITNDNTPTFLGTAEANSTVSLISSVSGTVATTTANGGGSWLVTVSTLSDGVHSITATATDAAGNVSVASSGLSVTIDTATPSVTSTAPAGAAATDTSVNFTVNFNESVSNISTDDFSLATSGATGTIASVSASSGASVTVTVNSIAGNGTIKVNLNGSTDITDTAGNAGPAAFTSGTTHTVAIPTVPDAPTIGTATAGDGQVNVTFTAPVNNGGSAITTYTATASPSGTTGSCAGPAACTITVTGLTNGTAYTFTVTATNAVGTSTASGSTGSATPKGNQTITFSNPGAQNFGATPTLSATSDSTLSVTFSSSTTSVCTITSGGALTLVSAGSCTIDADQAGNSSYLAAPTVSRIFNVTAVVPGVPTAVSATAGDAQASVSFSAPAFTGGAAITTYTVTSNPGGLTGAGAGSPITVTGLTNGVAYTFTVTATNSAGTGSASGASSAITPAAAQSITFTNPGAQNFGTTPTLTATSTSSLTPSFTSSTTGVCTITSGGLISFVSTGTCTINADQAGNASYLAAPTVTRSFGVNAVVPGAPTAATATAGDTQASISFTAPAFTGGASITSYTVTSNPGGLTGAGAASPVTVTGLTNGISYTFTVVATNSAGSGSASTASNAAIPKATQTITFAAPSAQNFGASPTLSATSDSGLTPVFSSSTAGICTITSGGTLTLVAAGTCTVNANEAGNATYLAATQVSHSFAVNAVAPGAPTSPSATAGDAQVTVTFSAPASTGGASISNYTVTASPGGITGSGTSSPVIVIGLTNGQPYTFTVRATNSAGIGSASAASNSATPMATQTITFANPGTKALGDSLSLTATSSSGLTPSFTSSSNSVCTVTSDGVVTLVSSGTCTISANQSGNSNYLAATPVTRSFTITPTPNHAPTVSGSPATSISESIGYSFTATGLDQDSDPLTYSIANKPSWASFNTSTGSLSGTPTNADVGITNNIVISVSDGLLSASLPAFNLTVINVNDAPVISGSPALTVTQDIVYEFTPTASDADKDTLTFSVVNKPSWASFDTTTGKLTGTPLKADVGTTNGIVIGVSDGTVSASLQAFSITVTNQNDAPVISGSPKVRVEQDATYQFTPTVSDADKDTLTFTIINKPTWASFNVQTGALTGTPTKTDVGVTNGIVISVSDGTLSASLPPFAIEVASNIDPLQPIVTAPTDIEIKATGLFTPVTLRQLLSLSTSASQTDIDQILKALASDGVNGKACCTTQLDGLTDTNTLLLKPGRHEIKWKAVNAIGITGEATQVVNISPIVSLSKSQIAVRGSTVDFRVILNGVAPVYPLTVPYTIDSATSATTAEYNLTSGSATFANEGQLEVAIPVELAAVTGFSDSQLVITLGSGINTGAANRHVIDIRQGNIPPVVSMNISQGGVSTTLITPSGGPVSVSVSVQDANKGDTHTFDWSATSGLADTDGDPTNASRKFDPTGLTGSHQLQVTVTDSAGATVQAQTYFRVVLALPTLSISTDTDNDDISDFLEGTGDADGNGIPDYLDNMPSTNILPQTGIQTNSYLLECDPGVRCGLGLFARSGSSGGVQILNTEVGTLENLNTDPLFAPTGGVFDFAIKDLPVPGQTVRVVIPQQAAIPANAVYRKFHNGQWVNFISNANNALHSTAGNPGYCPPPGSADWTPGLTQGHYCVQLTIEDGGPNDDDGAVNAAVADPGAVSTALPVVVPPVEPPNVEIKAKRGGAISEGWLLLLGGLMLARRIKPKWFALVALVLASVSTQADTSTYLRADTFQAKGDQTGNNFTHALGNHIFTLNTYESNRTGFQIAFGYQWHKFTYTELGYMDLGDAKVDLTLNGSEDLNAFGSNFNKHYPRTGAGITLVQGISLALSPAWTLSAEAGLFAWQDTAKLNITEVKFNNKHGVDVLFGARIEYQLNNNWRLGLNARRMTIDDQHVDLLGVSTAWQF